MTTKQEIADARRTAQSAYDEAQAADAAAEGAHQAYREAAQAVSDLEAAYGREHAEDSE